MELEFYFEPIDKSNYPFIKGQNSIAEKITIFNSDVYSKIESFNIALIGLQDDRNSSNKGTSKAAPLIRKHLYSLFLHNGNTSILDLGNLKNGKTVDDTYRALQDVVIYLQTKNIIPIIFGASQDMMFPISKTLKELLADFSISTIDSRLDSGNIDELHNQSVVKFIENEVIPDSYCTIGTQNYLIPQNELTFFEERAFKTFRLGKIRENIKKSEPLLRNAHFTTFDISAVRQCDAPGNRQFSPNGLTSEEICQLAKYSGISEKTCCYFLCECNPEIDFNEQTSVLSAHILWHIIDSISNRKGDYPHESIDELNKYMVNTEEFGSFFVFYKSLKTDRWWIEIINEVENTTKLTPCNYDDYLNACQNVIPDIYLQERDRQIKKKTKIIETY